MELDCHKIYILFLNSHFHILTKLTNLPNLHPQEAKLEIISLIESKSTGETKKYLNLCIHLQDKDQNTC